jgi:hypothetical protein
MWGKLPSHDIAPRNRTPLVDFRLGRIGPRLFLLNAMMVWAASGACSAKSPEDATTVDSLVDVDIRHTDGLGGDAQDGVTDSCRYLSTACDGVCCVPGRKCDSLCPADEVCIDGRCLCSKGHSVCNGICCSANEICHAVSGECCFSDSCVDKDCGDDGCGVSCGECESGMECFWGDCMLQMGMSCNSFEECAGLICVDSPAGGTVCSQECFDTCPQGWECKWLEQFDYEFGVCVPEASE